MKIRIPLIALLLSTVACGGAVIREPHDVVYQRVAEPVLHPAPSETDELFWWETFYQSSLGQIAAGYSPGAHLEPLLGSRPALDVNDFGKVPDSPWFENRLGKRDLSMTEIARGPNTSAGPAKGRLFVVAAKTEGVTPGLLVRDRLGVHWVVKFDPPAHPELSSAAEVITTKILHAAGYHVPENHIARFRLQDLYLEPGATTRDRYRRRIGLTREALDDAVTQLNPEPDGSIRALFSKVLPGRMLGPAPAVGVRAGDPNDTIAHEQRRSLRGLWVFYAWVNNSDAKSTNTMDAFVQESSDPALGHVRHYLIDFGSSLGASGNRPKPLREGYDHEVDWSSIGTRFVTLGAYYPYWSTLRRTPYRSVGPFESLVFTPGKWEPRHPVPAFELADREDTFWAASILAHFDEARIGAAVSTGEHGEPGAAEWVTQKLIERRNKMLAHAFRDMLPLDNPRVDDGALVVLEDLERTSGLRATSFGGYRWKLQWERDGGDLLAISAGRTMEPSIHLGAAVRWLCSEYRDELRDHPFLRLRLQEARPGRGTVTLRLRIRGDGTLMAVSMGRGFV